MGKWKSGECGTDYNMYDEFVYAALVVGRNVHLRARLEERKARAVEHGRQEPRRHHAGRQQRGHSQRGILSLNSSFQFRHVITL